VETRRGRPSQQLIIGVSLDFDTAAFLFRGSAAVSLNRTALNPRCPDRDQVQAHHAPAGSRALLFMKTIRPDNTDPIPLRRSPQGIRNIMLRFAVLLVLAMVVLALAWSR
jgi:hypothetical protein